MPHDQQVARCALFPPIREFEQSLRSSRHEKTLATVEQVTTRTAEPGSTATSSARFEGQFEDVETGLFYNYHRYYDPDSGRYISPDPIGTNGLLNLYHYCTNPVGFVDPFGLHELTVELAERDKDGNVTKRHKPGATAGHRNGKGGGVSSGGMHNGKPKKVPDKQPSTDTALFGLGKAHTERQALEWAKKVHGKKLNGSQLSMRGQFPPCTACSNAMRQFARNENCEIIYEYPNNRKMRYSPKKGAASPTPVRNAHRSDADDKALKDLCDSYQSETVTPKAMEAQAKAERKELGYQTSATGKNVRTNQDAKSSKDMYAKEKKQAVKGGVKEPTEFPATGGGTKRKRDSGEEPPAKKAKRK